MIVFLIVEIDINRSSSTSQNTGLAPAATIAHADAINEFAGQITSSPKLIFNDFKINVKASEPFPTPNAYFEPT